MNSQGKRTLHNEEEAYAWAAVGLKEHLPGEAMNGVTNTTQSICLEYKNGHTSRLFLVHELDS